MASPTSPPSRPDYLKREEIIGKQVISGSAKVLGTVGEIAFSSDGKIALKIDQKSTNEGVTQDVFIGSDDIQAISDVILLKPPHLTPPKETRTTGTGAASQTYQSSGAGSAVLFPPPAVTPQRTSPEPPPPPRPGEAAGAGKTCSRCGSLNGAGFRFCTRCGAPLL